MCMIIKNANVTTGRGSYKTDIAIKNNHYFPVDDHFEANNPKVINASTIITDSILHSFNSRH